MNVMTTVRTALVPVAVCVTLSAAMASCQMRTNGAPLLTRLSPVRADMTGGTVVELTVTGTGFDSLNTVHMGRLVIPAVPRLDDSTMRFAIPADDRFLPNRGGAPLTPLAGGTYEVRIETKKGMSNALSLVLVNGREAR